MFAFDEIGLTQALHTLPLKQRVAFAASCCERLYPNYYAFVLIEHWGDPHILRQALDQVWTFLDGATLLKDRIHELVRGCLAVVPDTEDFTSIFTGAALDAVSATIYTLESCLDGNPERVATVGRLATDTIDAYLDIVNYPDTGIHEADPAFDRWIQDAPLMMAELEKQQQDLESLRSQPTLDRAFLERLRQSSSILGLQPFRRGMVKAPDF